MTLQLQAPTERRTGTGDVFDYLHNEIVTLKFLPGMKLSEVEIAKQLGVSRQPVREAFIRLASQDLLLIRPQKATVVRKFSSTKIARARFLRQAVEVEVVRRACKLRQTAHLEALEKNLDRQRTAIDRNNVDTFHALDYDFHRLLCEAAESDFVYQTIAESKGQVDRLCILSLSAPAAMDDLYGDHQRILAALESRDETVICDQIIYHLSRLDDTLSVIREAHTGYFED